MKHFKLFENWINESGDNSWKDLLEIGKKYSKRATSRKFGLSDVDPIAELAAGVWSYIENGKIYGSQIPTYPCILAVSGTGDDYGNDEAWLIQNAEDLFRWVFTCSPGNKMFPDLTGEGYSDPIENFDEEMVEEYLEKISGFNSDQDEWSNGYAVEFFQDEKAMQDRIKESTQCPDCEGTGKDDEGEECEECDGAGNLELDSYDAYGSIIDGDYFPERNLRKMW